MRLNGIKIYSRVLFKNKILSFINLLGLTLGISSCILITLFVSDELSYDSQHQNIDRIFRVTTKFSSDGSIDHAAVSSSPLAYALKHTYPEVEDAVRFNDMGEATVERRNNLYKENSVFKADANVFNVFSYRFLRGNPQEALAKPQCVVLTKSIATKYFGKEEALGEILIIGRRDYLVTGIIDDVPLNSDLRFTMLASMDSTDYSGDWFDFSYYSYVLVDEKNSTTSNFISSFEKKIYELAADKINRPLRENNQAITASLHLQPLSGMHFQPSLLDDTPKGNANYVIIFSIAAFLLLVIGCLNYVNFSIVQSIERSKEVGIRKVVGANFFQLLFRYIGESFLFTFLALILALGLTVLILPAFNEVAVRDFNVADLFEGKILAAMFTILLVVGVLAGSYPAFYTSLIKPVHALKGTFAIHQGQTFRKISITAQFFISIGLIICTSIVYQQMTFIKNYDLGFRKDNVVVITIPSDTTLRHKIQGFKQRLLQSTSVKSVAIAGLGALPGSNPERGSITLKTDGKDEVRMVNYNFVDEDYLSALDIKLAKGRNYDGSPSDMQRSIIVNEALVRMMGWKNPLEQKIAWDGVFRDVIGVVRDFHYLSLHNKVEPQVIVYHENQIRNAFVALNREEGADQISLLREEWNKLFTDEPFIYKFLDESIQFQYQKEEKAMNIFTYFSLLTIVISCLGLFGLCSLTIYQRKKEIGIRKIVGANFISIIILIAQKYVSLIGLAIITVYPVSWVLMSRWLETFPYRESIEVLIYIEVGIGVIFISMLTIVASISKISSLKVINLIGD